MASALPSMKNPGVEGTAGVVSVLLLTGVTAV